MTITERLGKMSRPSALRWGLVLAAVIELVTVFLRFGLGLQSTRDTGFVQHLTLGLRIHHGYVGVVLLLFAWRMQLRWPGVVNLFLVIGVGLVLSDLAHHFLVLWPITGSPQFDIFYPRQ